MAKGLVAGGAHLATEGAHLGLHGLKTGARLGFKGVRMLLRKLAQLDLLNFDINQLKEKLKEAGLLEDFANNIQIVHCVLLSVLKLYATIISSMLTVFVPQRCISPQTGAAVTCSMHDCIFGLSAFGNVTLAMNLATFVVFVAVEIMFIYREAWLIQNLEEEPLKPTDQLKEDLAELPQFVTELRLWNLRACHAALISLGMYIVNFGMSAVVVLALRYDGVRTVTSLLTNTLLMSMRVINSANITYRCWSDENPRAKSLYFQKLVDFNGLDPNHVRTKEVWLKEGRSLSDLGPRDDLKQLLTDKATPRPSMTAAKGPRSDASMGAAAQAMDLSAF